MDNLSYSTLKKCGFKGFFLENAPEKILQFGKGNFLRGFVDYFVDVLNEKANFNAKIVICQSVKNSTNDILNEQNGLYNVYLQGFQDGEKIEENRLISCISRCINPYSEYEKLIEFAKSDDLRYVVSNTTEAGIIYDEKCKFSDCPPESFPAKLTQILYHRFVHFNGNRDKGLIIFPCELIDNNGKELLKCVQKYIKNWDLSSEFEEWVLHSNTFTTTAVDRIVTGFSTEKADVVNTKNGYIDNLFVFGEIYGKWVIEADFEEKNLFKQANLPIEFVSDLSDYKKIKVRILNGAHTSLVLGAFLSGKKIVRECMDDKIWFDFLKKLVLEEIIPTLSFDESELKNFAYSCFDRFQNPFSDHSLLAIALNSSSKFKTRVLPSILDYYDKFHTLPNRLIIAFAFFLAFYRVKKIENELIYGEFNGEFYRICDDKSVLEFFSKNAHLRTQDFVKRVCNNVDLWDCDLSKIPNLVEKVSETIEKIDANGINSIL